MSSDKRESAPHCRKAVKPKRRGVAPHCAQPAAAASFCSSFVVRRSLFVLRPSSFILRPSSVVVLIFIVAVVVNTMMVLLLVVVVEVAVIVVVAALRFVDGVVTLSPPPLLLLMIMIMIMKKKITAGMTAMTVAFRESRQSRCQGCCVALVASCVDDHNQVCTVIPGALPSYSVVCKK